MVHQGEKFIERFTSESYLSIIRGWQNFTLSSDDLNNISSKKVLVLSVNSDVCFYPEEQTELTEVLLSKDAIVKTEHLISDKGHDSFLLEPNLYKKPIRNFLKI